MALKLHSVTGVQHTALPFQGIASSGSPHFNVKCPVLPQPGRAKVWPQAAPFPLETLPPAPSAMGNLHHYSLPNVQNLCPQDPTPNFKVKTWGTASS